MGVRHMLTLLMMTALTLVSGASIAAAMCSHQNAQAHAAALHDGDEQVADVARQEDAVASTAAKKGVLDSSAFSVPAFILPSQLDAPAFGSAEPLRLRPPDAPERLSAAVRPPLRPPAA